MRLSAHEVATIKTAASEAFGKDAVVRLFGSRVDDAKRGGDIDLHVVSPGRDIGRENEMHFRAHLADRLDDEPIDVVVHTRGEPLRWIDRAALRDGLIL